ncbi:alpha-1,6-mannosyl-glycoprotein 2-beta-N-acetylglucosaminyltransferase isoform X2 [Venturia canescens]|uniref:alpha-1,6-mannosyl-glycoprotein 2-beta-N-acetylglucosaminyltransferase isoform X2 n=1 Tax=Venturia canescens TaxID=32260 RepID=UPI001C9CC449|nr:alpha-1,6-mannosyl-glycoprotein 2-beta-N-acetylglucosaminyltransferase isoform X2 [Venturia canescens]XP_043267487.1 alpha-1,6-mannosyl-glycoprotein 2-beta-N-acetylglucosaminyltransferase isoform X2 [Venturia canescens]XP_043267495.1 alpha-1,6-mannosyl-glycoprotein 2-beta-N-acetylglucosaminyltransferase isoform X2 [Venturia canescens]XP_043267505.1 alpha-1,6-mannosyl-glycoprotein 2-beta-N-acetylglucosaminyltransferase isoform X2 [Venturia canescens]
MRGVTVVAGVRSGRGTLLRTLVLVFLATFLWLQLHVISLTGRNSQSQSSANESLFALVPQELHRFLKERRNSSAVSNGTSGTLTDLEIIEIRRNISRLNSEQRVYNDDAFGPLSSDAPVIVVQVHSRLTYLRHVIVSLAQARGIEQALLIFSHDVWHPDINDLIQSVDFCRVMQIFYPYSMQTHPNTFPGEDPNDCPRNIDKQQAANLKCINAQHPDLYGHYREAKFTQPKHHWWWKANRVFDQLVVTRNHTGMVLFLEEDHYVAEDFLHVLRLMERTAKHSCQRCNVLSLGTYLKTYNYYSDTRKYLGVNGALQKELLRGLTRHDGSTQQGSVSTYQNTQTVQASPSWAFQLLPSLYSHYQKAEVIPWISSKHNMGMAFNRITWNKLRKCASQFCSYDDYNWDWSLQHVAQTCLPPSKGAGAVPRLDSGLVTMMMRAPRVFHIGECGVHHKKNNCESTAVIAKVQNVLKTARPHLFPTQLTLTIAGIAKKTKLRKGNGGWGDIRDHELCSNITINPDFALP